MRRGRTCTPGRVLTGLHGHGGVHGEDAIRFPDRQRAQQHGVGNAAHGRGGANADRQGAVGYGREDRLFAAFGGRD
jgi:hypothetical protein